MEHDGPTLYLCAGLQSSGSTLVSWCFLQRPDLDGILDARNDVLLDAPPGWPAPRFWCKTTIVAFRLREQVLHYQDAGWNVRPLLVLRDVRRVFASLLAKSYFSNGLTAEEPPLRLRLRCFKDDWEWFRDLGLPMIRYESLVLDPVGVLKQTCAKLGLPWDSSMVGWPKRHPGAGFDGGGSQTFQQTRGQTWWDSVRPEMASLCVERIPAEDLEWLEDEFQEFNEAMGYVTHADKGVPASAGRAVATFHGTKRYRRLRRDHFLAWLLRSVPYVDRAWQRVYRKNAGLSPSMPDSPADCNPQPSPSAAVRSLAHCVLSRQVTTLTMEPPVPSVTKESLAG